MLPMVDSLDMPGRVIDTPSFDFPPLRLLSLPSLEDEPPACPGDQREPGAKL